MIGKNASKGCQFVQRGMNEELTATTSQLDTTEDCWQLEETRGPTDEALRNIEDIAADVSTIKGQVERLLKWKLETEKRLSKMMRSCPVWKKNIQKHYNGRTPYCCNVRAP